MKQKKWFTIEDQSYLIWVTSLANFSSIYLFLLIFFMNWDMISKLQIHPSTFNPQYLVIAQMVGVFWGGIFWGIKADKRGRHLVLFDSILWLSIISFLNGLLLASNPDTSIFKNEIKYLIILFLLIFRAVTGFILSGELGISITLIVESVLYSKREKAGGRIVASGFLGAIAAYLMTWISEHSDMLLLRGLPFYFGALSALILYLLRKSKIESNLFIESLSEANKKGLRKETFFERLKKNKGLRRTFVLCNLLLITVWFVMGVLISHAEDYFEKLDLCRVGKIDNKLTLLFAYCGLIIGTIICTRLSRKLKSRKKALLIFYVFSSLMCLWYLNPLTQDFLQYEIEYFYFKSFMIGISLGYWAIAIIMTSESFSTDMRATVTTIVPNISRGMLIVWSIIPLNVFPKNQFLITYIVLVILIGLNFYAVYKIKETYFLNIKKQ